MFNSSVQEWLEANNAAVLTWYSTDGRVEFVGPVMSRWVAKSANYLVETFGEGEEPSVVLSLPDSWRTVAWAAGAGLAGAKVTVSDSPDLSEADVFVTADEDVAARVAEEDPGLIVLLQDLGLMTTSWEGELPDGVEDAIAEVSGQPDGIAFVDVQDADIPGGMPAPGAGDPTGHVVIMTDAPRDYIGRIWQAWISGRPALWVDPSLDIDRILEQEKLASFEQPFGAPRATTPKKSRTRSSARRNVIRCRREPLPT